MRFQGLDAVGGHADDLGQQQALRFEVPVGDPRSKLLVQDPLVQGVLIDDHQPVVGLCDDESVVNLDRLRLPAKRA